MMLASQAVLNKGLRAIVVLVACAYMHSLIASPQQCTRAQAIQAETEASTLKTWAKVFTSYQRYKQCDDGAIAEGYSGSVADLLAGHWDRIGELVRLSASHPGFEHFVINHVDVTMSMDQYKVIRKRAKYSCPATARQLCAAIEKRLSELEALDR
jgi:hypothetical protein